MKKNKKTMTPMEYEFYSIQEIDGKKYVHVWGYIFENDGCWTLVEYVGHITPIEEFVAGLKEDADYVDNKAQELNQYSEDMPYKDVQDIIKTFFDGHPAQYCLNYREITEKAPCGDYIF